jgi:hypothetical protein
VRSSPRNNLSGRTAHRSPRGFAETVIATTLIGAGEHPKIIQHRMGHASIAETMEPPVTLPGVGRLRTWREGKRALASGSFSRGEAAEQSTPNRHVTQVGRMLGDERVGRHAGN